MDIGKTDWHPTTNEELDAMVAERRRNNDIGSGVLILGILGGVIFSVYVLIHINTDTIPKPYRFLAHPVTLTVAFYAVIVLIFLLSKFGRHCIASMPKYGNAGCFDRARQAYGIWQKKYRKRYLKISYDLIQQPHEVLKDVPEFNELYEKIMTDMEKIQ